jgi:Methyltransferase domain
MLKNAIEKIPGSKRLAQILGLVPKQANGRAFLLAMLPKHSLGAEIGVHKGDFSQQIIEVVSPKELHLVDPWEHQTSAIYKDAWYGGKAKAGQNEMDKRYSNVCNRFDKEIQAERVKVHRGYSNDILDRFPDEYFDWIYIDGNHLYEYVKEDLELSFRKTKSGGFITGDDYTSGGWWEGGVKKAVDEFAKNPAIQLIEIRNRQFAFQKK